MKKIVLYSFLLLLARDVSGQVSAEGNIVGTTGGNGKVNTFLTDWSVGGTATAETFTLPDGYILSQGYLQPYGSIIQLLISLDALPGKTYGDVNFELHGVAADGLELVYTSGDESIAKVINGNIVQIVGAGTTYITATIKNTTTSVQQRLVVDKATQTISFDVIDVLYKNGASVNMNARANSGLPVEFKNSNPFVVKVDGTVLIPVDIGSATIEVSQAGDANHYPALVSQVVKVIDATGAQISVPLVLSPNGDGLNDQFVIKGIENYPDNMIVIANRNGTKVYETKGYNNSEKIFSGQADPNKSFEGAPLSSFPTLPAGTYFYVVQYKDGAKTKRVTGYFVLKY